jgi:proteasome lid subunit RPN8/RPN11
VTEPFRLCIPRPILEAVVAQAVAEQPLECCGLLAGIFEDAPGTRIGRVVERFPLVNVLASPTRFEAEPKSMLAADRAMRQRRLEMLAVYHSHPTSDPIPSRTDLERNGWMTNVVTLIVSLAATPPSVRGWWLTETSYHEAEWDIS